MEAMKWEVGQTVDVQSRTWAGINKPGGCAKITKIHYAVDGLNVESIDVKYVLGGGYEKAIDPAIVSPFETLDRRGRKRRGRDFLMERADDVVKKIKQVMHKDEKENAATTTLDRKTKEPDQSTSPSTPVTPEHPSLKAAKPPRVNLLSVPSYVIADRTIEVSPLPLDRAVVAPSRATVPRRGLFGCAPSTSQAKHVVAKPAISKKPVEDVTFHQTSRQVSQAHSAAMKETLAIKCGRNLSAKLGTKKAPLTEHKSKDDRKSATTHLNDVYNYELRKAKEFLDEVCRAPTDDVDVIKTSSKENRLNTSSSEVDERKPEAHCRREEFLNLFRSLRRKFDEEDGMMEEAQFLASVSNHSKNPFTTSEVENHLKYLYQEGKLMKSDGFLYIID